MTDSKRLAGLLGPTLIALAATEAMNPQIWSDVPATEVYLAGALWFVAGLSIVRIHNRWSLAWPSLITVIGWFALLGGLLRMAAPGLAQQSVPSAPLRFASQMILLVIGLYLTLKGYART